MRPPMISALFASVEKSTCGGEIGFARRAQRLGVGMAGDGLQGLAETLAHVAIVDDERNASRRVTRRRARARWRRSAIRRSSLRAPGAIPAASVASKCGNGSRAAPMTSSPLGATSTTRSCQPSACLTAWCTGSASMNSLAMMMAGPPGTSVSAGCHSTGSPSPCSRRCCAACQLRTDLDHMQHDRGVENCVTVLAARSASIIKVPRPGPSSTMRTFSGAPICCQTATIHKPDEFAEHLADFRRGDEIAAGARSDRGVM